jgi:hypothetical protein
MKAPEPKTRLEMRDEVLWAPETKIASVLSAKFSISIAEVEERFRAALLNTRFPNLQRIEGIPLVRLDKVEAEVEAEVEVNAGVKAEVEVNAGVKAEVASSLVVRLANGQAIRCSQIIYADRWSLLRKFEGFPKALKFLQKRDSTAALQAVFDHRSPVGLGVGESFYASLHKENGEEIDRNLWGYFSSDGMRSFWTLFLAEDEVENNHEIAKKFRRLKSTLDRIFTGDAFIPKNLDTQSGSQKPESSVKFSANIIGEQVRLIEDAVFAKGEFMTEPVSLSQLPGVVFLTDGYGPSAALQQVGALLGVNVLV